MFTNSVYGHYTIGATTLKVKFSVVFTVQEESALEKYLIDMADYGHPLSTKQLRL